MIIEILVAAIETMLVDWANHSGFHSLFPGAGENCEWYPDGAEHLEGPVRSDAQAAGNYRMGIIPFTHTRPQNLLFMFKKEIHALMLYYGEIFLLYIHIYILRMFKRTFLIVRAEEDLKSWQT